MGPLPPAPCGAVSSPPSKGWNWIRWPDPARSGHPTARSGHPGPDPVGPPPPAATSPRLPLQDPISDPRDRISPSHLRIQPPRRQIQVLEGFPASSTSTTTSSPRRPKLARRTTVDRQLPEISSPSDPGTSLGLHQGDTTPAYIKAMTPPATRIHHPLPQFYSTSTATVAATSTSPPGRSPAGGLAHCSPAPATASPTPPAPQRPSPTPASFPHRTVLDPDSDDLHPPARVTQKDQFSEEDLISSILPPLKSGNPQYKFNFSTVYATVGLIQCDPREDQLEEGFFPLEVFQ